VTSGASSDNLRHSGFASAGSTPQDDGREEFFGFNGAQQQLARADGIFITDLLTHPG